jgi:hypothetical protein
MNIAETTIRTTQFNEPLVGGGGVGEIRWPEQSAISERTGLAELLDDEAELRIRTITREPPSSRNYGKRRNKINQSNIRNGRLALHE